MGLTTEHSRSRDEVAADFSELAMVDWLQVWSGYSEADPRTWCAERGWRLEKLDRVEDVTARLGSGGLLYLRQDRQAASPVPVASAAVYFWRAKAQSPDDNGALFTAADEVWSDYVAGVSEAIGSPAVVTSFDDPAFPDLPDWPPQDRARWRNPYRLALWSFNGALAQLYVGPSGNAITADQRGGIRVKLLLRPAAAAEPTGAA
jgi:hypothetical protein